MRRFFHFLIIVILCSSFVQRNYPFELVGHVKTIEGIVVSGVYVQIWHKGEVIAQTKTDNFGNYVLPVPKIGEFNIMAGNKNRYFHPNTIKEFSFHTPTRFKQNFKLEIDKQILQHETTRLRESYNHMMRNPKNLDYKRAFFKRFPASGYEMELFFSKDIEHKNLKKVASEYLRIVFDKKVVGWAAYMNKFIKFGQKTNMAVAGKMTQKFYDGAAEIIKEHPHELFKELATSSDRKVTRFFVFLFSGKGFGKKKPTKDFDFLSGKYNREYALMLDAFDLYLNGE